MEHWHAASCLSPVVELNEASSPRCLTCGYVFSLADLLSKQGPSSYPPTPSDKPLGELNLSWPPTVPYRGGIPQHLPWNDAKTPLSEEHNARYERRSSLQHNLSTTVPHDLEAARRMLLQMSVKNAPNTPDPYLYERRLSPDEIRLICIPAGTEETAPIHISLEVHQHDRCPEYEALSYTWGGENNDNDRIHPIYVGPYWHVLLQTKNCLDMLHFLRPSRGVRLVWIDAICINQFDDEEKTIQVSNMARIYEACRRAVVFLGKDVVRNESGQHPLRMSLGYALQPDARTGEFVNACSLDVLGLLRRRYFKRVWIMQELIRSPRVVIQFHDVELWVEPRAPLYQGRWDLTPVPWFIYLTQQQLESSSVYDVVQATWMNQATDVRDKVFGVHALLGDPSSSQALVPDYKLSCLEVYIGLFAHMLLFEGRVEILYNAAGMSMVGRRPTWLPDWSVSDVKKLFKVFPSDEGADIDSSAVVTWNFEPAYELLQRGWLRSLCQSTEQDFYVMVQEPPEPFDRDKNLLHVSSRSASTNYSGIMRSTSVAAEPLPSTWRRSASVNARTGGLTINLIRIHQFRAKPRPWGVWEDSQLFRIESPTGKAAMYLSVKNLALNEIIIPGLDHLFLLPRGSNKSCMYLILRTVQAAQPQHYTLVGVPFHLCLEVDMGTYRTEVDVYSNYKYDETESYKHSKIVVRKRDDTRVFVNDLVHSAHDLLSHARKLVYSRLPADEQARFDTLFPGKCNQKDPIQLAGVLQALLTETNSNTGHAPTRSAFLAAYTANIDPRFSPRVHADHVEMTIDPADWESMHAKRFSTAYTKAFKEWRYDGKHKWSTKFVGNLVAMLGSDKRPEMRTHVRAARGDLERLARETEMYRALAGLTGIVRRRGGGETELGLVLLPEEETEGVAESRWPGEVVEEFEVDGSEYRVTIV